MNDITVASGGHYAVEVVVRDYSDLPEDTNIWDAPVLNVTEINVKALAAQLHSLADALEEDE